MNNNNMDFTQTVKQIMQKQGMRRAELARQMGYSGQYIRDLLAGRKRWNIVTMTRAAEVLGIKIEFKEHDRIGSN